MKPSGHCRIPSLCLQMGPSDQVAGRTCRSSSARDGILQLESALKDRSSMADGRSTWVDRGRAPEPYPKGERV